VALLHRLHEDDRPRDPNPDPDPGPSPAGAVVLRPLVLVLALALRSGRYTPEARRNVGRTSVRGGEERRGRISPAPPTALRRTWFGPSRTAWMAMVWANDPTRLERRGGVRRRSEGSETETETKSETKWTSTELTSVKSGFQSFSTMTMPMPVRVEANRTERGPSVSRCRRGHDPTLCSNLMHTISHFSQRASRTSREGTASRRRRRSRSRHKTSLHSYNVQPYNRTTNRTELPSFSIPCSISTFCHRVTRLRPPFLTPMPHPNALEAIRHQTQFHARYSPH
jgi:hypothetical protein